MNVFVNCRVIQNKVEMFYCSHIVTLIITVLPDDCLLHTVDPANTSDPTLRVCLSETGLKLPPATRYHVTTGSRTCVGVEDVQEQFRKAPPRSSTKRVTCGLPSGFCRASDIEKRIML